MEEISRHTTISSQLNQFEGEKMHQNWMKNKNSIYPPNSVGNWLEKTNQSE
jgi:hypothetical protein